MMMMIMCLKVLYQPVNHQRIHSTNLIDEEEHLRVKDEFFWRDVMVPYAAYISPCNTFLLGGRLYYGLYMRDPQRGYGCQQGLYTVCR